MVFGSKKRNAYSPVYPAPYAYANYGYPYSHAPYHHYGCGQVVLILI